MLQIFIRLDLVGFEKPDISLQHTFGMGVHWSAEFWSLLQFLLVVSCPFAFSSAQHEVHHKESFFSFHNKKLVFIVTSFLFKAQPACTHVTLNQVLNRL